MIASALWLHASVGGLIVYICGFVHIIQFVMVCNVQPCYPVIKQSITPSVILTKEFMCFWCYFLRVNKEIFLWWLISVFFLFLFPLTSPSSLPPLPPLPSSFLPLIHVSFHSLGLMNICAGFLWREDKLSMHFLLVNGFSGLSFIIWVLYALNRQWRKWSRLSLVICPQLSGNSLGSLIEIKDCHLPHTLLVPGRRPGLFSPGKRISYISFRCLDFTLRLNYL